MTIAFPMTFVLAMSVAASAFAQGSSSPAAATAAEADPELPPEAAASACRPDADRRRGLALGRALEAGFGVQYWGEGYNAAGLAERPHGLLILELAKLGAQDSQTGREELFTEPEIAMIRQDGARPVLGYLNVGEIEDYRDYWVDFSKARAAASGILPEWFGPQTADGDHLSAFWTPEWRDILLTRVDRLMETGADGLFLDDVLHYYTHAADDGLTWPGEPGPGRPSDAPGYALAMMDLVVAIAERARRWNCDAFVLVNNAVFIGRDAGEVADEDGRRPGFDAYLAAIDGISAENALASWAHPHTREALAEDFLDGGVKVLTLDSLTSSFETDYASLRQNLSEEAFAAGFAPYVVENEGYNQLFPPLIPPEKS